MPRYQYLAVAPDGQRKTGGVDAANEAAARAMLVRRRLLPVELGAMATEHAAARTSVGRVAARARLSQKALLLFTRQLATLVDAAVPVDEALAMIAAQSEEPNAHKILSDVQAGVVEGERLADALSRHSRSFSGLYRAAIAGGERAGKLGFVLTRLADYLGRAYAMRTKVTTALIYPAALSTVAVAVVACLMIFVVPSLTEQFERFDQTLPLLTQILIAVSGFLSTFWPLLLAMIAAGALIARSILRQEHTRSALDAFLLRAPLLGRWVMAVNASRFIRAVSTLVASGLPVLEAVRAACEAVDNRAASAAIARMGDWIEEGDPLSQAMRRSGIMPPMVSYMAQSGENAGELTGMLDKAAEHLDQEFEAFTARALALLEPAIIVFMGLVVASIVMAIMLPILQLNRLALG